MDQYSINGVGYARSPQQKRAQQLAAMATPQPPRTWMNGEAAPSRPDKVYYAGTRLGDAGMADSVKRITDAWNRFSKVGTGSAFDGLQLEDLQNIRSGAVHVPYQFDSGDLDGLILRSQDDNMRLNMDRYSNASPRSTLNAPRSMLNGGQRKFASVWRSGRL